MKQKWQVIVLAISILIIGTETSFAVSPFVAGAATSGGSYAIAKVMQHIHDLGPYLLRNMITRDHFGGLAMIIALTPAMYRYIKTHISPIVDFHKREQTLKQYQNGVITALLGTIALEAYLRWTGDWRTTLFPTFFK